MMRSPLVETESAKDTREELAIRLRNTIARASRRLRQEANPGLPLSLMSALGALDTHGPMTPSELAAQERLARPGVTRMIARLTEEGLVSQQADPLDGRSYTLSITSRGHAVLARSRRRRARFLSRALRRLDDRELA